MAGQICSTPPGQPDLLSRSHQFLCGLIRLIRSCASFQGTQASGVAEGMEASSQDLSAPYPAAGKSSQGQPGGLLWEGRQQLQSASSLPPPTLPSFLSGSQYNWQGGHKQSKTVRWQTFGAPKMANLKLPVQLEGRISNSLCLINYIRLISNMFLLAAIKKKKKKHVKLS